MHRKDDIHATGMLFQPIRLQLSSVANARTKCSTGRPRGSSEHVPVTAFITSIQQSTPLAKTSPLPPFSNPMPTYLFGLVLHTLNARPNSIDITKVLSAEGGNGTIGCRRGDDTQVIVELVDQRSAGGDVELGNVILRNIIQMLHKGAEGVAVGKFGALAAEAQEGLPGVLPRLLPVAAQRREGRISSPVIGR